MRQLIFVVFIGLLVSLTSCRNDFEFQPSTGNLEFSRDTVYLDTVFTNIGSSTYTLKVYNKSDTDISIPAVRLGKGQQSKYRMTVDGMTGNDNRIFNNVELLANDSLYIFIETTAGIADANPDDFLYTDQIVFEQGSNEQKVELVTLIQDAYFIFPKRNEGIYDLVDFGFDAEGNTTQVRGRNLEENHPDNGNEYEWGNDKPYVVYGFASVPNGKTLTVNAGARIHFHAESGIIVQEGGTLSVEGALSTPGTLDNEVIFESDRLEPGFADTPGQWGFVYLRQGSTNHSIDYLTIKNATVGLYVENNFGNPMTINNTQIYNASVVGILARFARIDGFNIVINTRTRGIGALACTYGGSYNFTHCSFNNESSSSTQFAVIVDNFYLDTNNQPVAFDLTQANFNNCIIYGANSRQLLLNKDDSKLYNFKFNNCLIRFNNQTAPFNTLPQYDFTNSTFYEGNLIAQNFSDFLPDFLDPANNKLVIGMDSAAKGTADFTFSNGTTDISGFPRATPSDIGAYNAILFEEE